MLICPTNAGGDGLTNEELDALVLRLMNGDQSVCTKIYTETVGLAWSTAHILLHQHEDIQDVLQISYSKAFQRIDQLESPAYFRAWLRRIILNESKNYLKKSEGMESADVLRLTELPEKEPQDHQANELLNRAELRDLIETALASLSEDKRRCLELFYFENLKISEIAALLSLPEGTVKSRLNAAKKELRRKIESNEDFGSLFSFSLLPLLFAQQAQTTSVPAQLAETVGAHVSATAGAAATGASGVAAGSAAATTGAAAAAASAGTAAGSTAVTAAAGGLAIKIAAVAAAGAVAVGGGVAVKHQVELTREAPTEILAAIAETATSEETLAALLQTLSDASSKTEETTTAAPRMTETKPKATISQQAAASTMAQPTSTAARTQRTAATTAEKRTTTKAATTKATKAATTKTEKKTTTQKQTTTVKQITTTEEEQATTRDAAADYHMSGSTLTGYDGDKSSVSIPSSVQGTPVTAIGAGAFSGNTSVRSVSIPSGITQIGQEAFSDCTSLSSVSLPSTLARIGIGAFYGCSSLKNVTVPAGTTTISDEAFAQCSALKTVTIPASVTSISDDAFDGCDNVTIQCKAGSAAESYAIENGIPYRLI